MPQTLTRTPVTTVTAHFAQSDAKRLARLKGVIPYQSHAVERHALPHAGSSIACGVMLNHHDVLAASRPHVTETTDGYELTLSLSTDIAQLDHITHHLVQVLGEYAPRADVRLTHT